MNPLLIILATTLLISCQTRTELFNDVKEMAEFDRDYKLTLIQSGKENGFLKPLAEYSLFTMDSSNFRSLKNSVFTNDNFKEGKFYFNIELNDYIYENDLNIINMSKSLITKNKYDEVYYLYLLSDRKTMAVVKVKT